MAAVEFSPFPSPFLDPFLGGASVRGKLILSVRGKEKNAVGGTFHILALHGISKVFIMWKNTNVFNMWKVKFVQLCTLGEKGRFTYVT